MMKNLGKIVFELKKLKKFSYKKLRKILSKYPKEENQIYSKSEILEKYQVLVESKSIQKDPCLEEFLKTKPTRTISGVAPVTVLTKPYACPGKCIFCPTMSDQPKSYISSEPGAMRAKMLGFDPFNEVQVRIKALQNIGHNTQKVELIILGGTWSAYPKKYQLWFISQCFKALNDLAVLDAEVQTRRFEPALRMSLEISSLKSMLLKEHKRNETARHRCVGLVIETRPDFVNKEEVKWLRFLGVTKVQLGIQSLNDEILKLNKRGHTVSDTKEAIKLLRLAGFKLHLHWMLNLYGSNSKRDYEDFKRLFSDKSIRPDELKIYPCLLLKDTELYDLYKKGKYKPYTRKQLLELLIKCKKAIPKYCRVSRLFRDIPSFEIAAGVKETNFREIVKEEMEQRGLRCNCIRCREIKNEKLKIENLKLEINQYKTNVTNEYFLSYVTDNNFVAGFLRLSLPTCRNYIYEIQDSAMIREVHVYGISKQLTAKQPTAKQLTANSETEKGAQHYGIGTKLIQKAEEIAKKAGFGKIAVISAIGTREYYRKRGYGLEELYMGKEI